MKILSVVSFILSGLAAWIMWGPLRELVFSLLPTQYPWIRILSIVGIGYFGGISIPLFFVFVGVIFLLDE